MKKTLLVGNFGSGNIGDEMILCAALNAFRDKNVEGRSIVVMTADEEWTRAFIQDYLQVEERGSEGVEEEWIEFVPFFPTGARSISAWMLSSKYRKLLLNLQDEVDEIIFAGGGLFAIKARACWIWSAVFWWCKKTFPKAKIRLEYQGVDQKFSAAMKKLIVKVFGSADYISVRDTSSKKALRSLGIHKKIDVVGDRVEEWLISDKEIKRKKVPKRDKKVLLLNSVSMFEQLFYSRIQNKYKNYALRFVLMDPMDQQWIPTGFRGDIVVMRNKEEVFETFSNADLAIGERLHFLVLAQSFLGSKKTKSLKEPYSEKVQSFCDRYEILVITE